MKQRRVYSQETKESLLRDARVPGAMLADVAKKHGVTFGTATRWAHEQRNGAQHIPEKPAASAWCLFSDWHLGALVESRHMSGRFAYDSAIARDRIELLGREIRRVIATQSSRFDIQRLYLLWAGDILDGCLAYRGQRYRLELATTRMQREFGLQVILPLVDDLCDIGVPHVASIAVEGNHGRGAYADEEEPDGNADTRLFEWVAAESERDGLHWQVGQFGEQILDVVTNRTVGVEHGQFIGGSKHGSLTAGSFSHIWQRCAEIGAVLDVYAFGHRHQPVYIHGRPHVFANGSLTGYNEFARDRGFRPCQPQQWTWGLTESGLAWSESIVLGGWADVHPEIGTGVLRGSVRNAS